MESLWRDFDVSAGWLDGWLVRNPSRQPCKVPHAVRDVSLPISRGTALELVGESGSGKSTVARMIAGLTPPTAGRVVTDGIDRWADKAGAAPLRRVTDVNPTTRASTRTSSPAASGSASRSPGRWPCSRG
jgi:peptide/nickel transport system ATP-binding protein